MIVALSGHRCHPKRKR